MALFETDLMALLVVSIVLAGALGINRLVSFLLKKTTLIKINQKNKISFVLKLVSIVAVVYLIVEGFPSFQNIPEDMRTILTGAISTALAFISSEIFADLLSGMLIFFIDPFDLGDIVKINKRKGIIKSISLTKIVIETFNNVPIEMKNSEVINSNIVNYTIELKNIEHYEVFKKKLQTPQDRGKARIDLNLNDEVRDYEKEYREMFKLYQKKDYSHIHMYTFRMGYQYDQFRIRLHKSTLLCDEYKEIFGFRPRFHVMGYGNRIVLKFQIFTFSLEKIRKYQPQFAYDLYKISMGSL